VRAYRDGLGAELRFSASMLVVVAASLLVMWKYSMRSETMFEPLATLNIVVARIVGQATVGKHRVVFLLRRFGPGAVYALACGAVPALLSLAVRVDLTTLPLIVTGFYVAVTSVILLQLGRSDWSRLGVSLSGTFQELGGRYFYVPIATLYLAFVATWDRLR